MSKGQTGIYDRNYRRFVRIGGSLLFRRQWFQHDCLLEWVNKEILINEIGWCSSIDIYQCWYPCGTANRYVKGTPIIINLEPLHTDY